MSFPVPSQVAKRYAGEVSRQRRTARSNNGHAALGTLADALESRSSPVKQSPVADRHPEAPPEGWEPESVSRRYEEARAARPAWDIRFIHWLVARAKKFLQWQWKAALWKATFWLGKHYILGRMFTVAHLAGPASTGEFTRRMGTCGSCEFQTVRDGRPFCRSCGCGTHRLADLRYKNRLAFWSCPRLLFGRARPWWRKRDGGK